MSATATMTFTETETRKPPAPRTSMPPLLDEPITKDNWYKVINWLHLILLTSTPIAAIYGMATTKLETPTLIWSIVWYFATGLGITAGECRNTHVCTAFRLFNSSSWDTNFFLFPSFPPLPPFLPFFFFFFPRISSPLVSPRLQRHPVAEVYLQPYRRRCLRRLYSLVEPRPPCPPPLH